MEQSAKQIGIERFGAHDLRRTCAKLCRKAGGDLEQIKFLLGHPSIQTTEGYLGWEQQIAVAVKRQSWVSDQTWPMMRLSRAAMTTSAVISVSPFTSRTRSICARSRLSRRKFLPVMRMIAAVTSTDIAPEGRCTPAGFSDVPTAPAFRTFRAAGTAPHGARFRDLPPTPGTTTPSLSMTSPSSSEAALHRHSISSRSRSAMRVRRYASPREAEPGRSRHSGCGP